MFVESLTRYIDPPYYRYTIHRCIVFTIEWSLILVDVVQSLLNMCLYDVCSLILTEPNTNQIYGGPIMKTRHL